MVRKRNTQNSNSDSKSNSQSEENAIDVAAEVVEVKKPSKPSNASSSNTTNSSNVNKKKSNKTNPTTNNRRKTTSKSDTHTNVSNKFGGFISIPAFPSYVITEVRPDELYISDGTMLPSLFVRNVCFTPVGSPGSQCYKDFFQNVFPKLQTVINVTSNYRIKIVPDQIWKYFNVITYALGLCHFILKCEQIILSNDYELVSPQVYGILLQSFNQDCYAVARRLLSSIETLRIPKRLTNMTIELFSPNYLSGTKSIAWILPLCPIDNNMIFPIIFGKRNSILDSLYGISVLISTPYFNDISGYLIRSNLYESVIISKIDSSINSSTSLETIWFNLGRVYETKPDSGIFHNYFQSKPDLNEEFIYHSTLENFSIESLSFLGIDISDPETLDYKFIDYKPDDSILNQFTYGKVINSLKAYVSMFRIFYGRVSFPAFYKLAVYSPRAVYTGEKGIQDITIELQTFVWPSRIRDLFSAYPANIKGKDLFLGYRPVSDVKNGRITFSQLKDLLFKQTSEIFINVTPTGMNKAEEFDKIP